MNYTIVRKYTILILWIVFIPYSAFCQNEKTNYNKWKIGNLIFEQGEKGTFDEISVKDPSVVFYKNAWHLFYTARNESEYTTGYVSAKKLEDLNSAPRFELEQIRGKTRYGCAPQIFFFEPQKKWYLIFQNRDSNYQPAFSTNTKIEEPKQWTAPQKLLKKDSNKKWIDFWIIADKEKVYLFYTKEHSDIIVRSTGINNFPNGWSKGNKIFDNVHEAVHIYKDIDKNEFHMIYELNNNGIRSFGMATANYLDGPWKKITDNYATGNQLQFTKETQPWTDMVSHGEIIRSGYNQDMEYDSEICRWLIQGILKKDLNIEYPSLPWKLGVIEID